MEYTIFTDMFTALNNALAGIIGKYAGILGFISGPLRAGITIYIILLGFAILRGAVQYPFREFVFRSGKLALVVVAVTSLYGASVGLLAMDGLPSEVSRAVSTTSVNGLGDFFDSILEGAERNVGKIDELVAENTEEEGENWAGIPNNWDEIILSKVCDIIILLAALISAALGFCICAFALFALALLAAVGPIFVAALLFDSTRSFFFQWLGSVVNYVILVAFALLVTVFITDAATTVLDAVSTDDLLIVAVAKILGFYVLGFFFFLQVPGLAAGLGGGGASLASQFAAAVVNAPAAASSKLISESAKYNQRRNAAAGGGTVTNTTR